MPDRTPASFRAGPGNRQYGNIRKLAMRRVTCRNAKTKVDRLFAACSAGVAQVKTK